MSKTTQPSVDALKETVDKAWQEIGRDAPGLDENYWDAGVTSLEVALFADALSRHVSVDVEFVDVLEYPDTSALASFLCARETDRH
jgi:Phosphopantetheine attachment site